MTGETEGMKRGGKVHNKKMAGGGRIEDEEQRTHSELKMKHGGKTHHKKTHRDAMIHMG